MFLVVFKQPGANVINTVEAIKKTLASLEAAIPPSIHVSVLSDRTTTIRASVRRHAVHPDLTSRSSPSAFRVLFLRDVSATVVPNITVPLALLGARALMYG